MELFSAPSIAMSALEQQGRMQKRLCDYFQDNLDDLSLLRAKVATDPTTGCNMFGRRLFMEVGKQRQADSRLRLGGRVYVSAVHLLAPHIRSI